MKDQEQTYLNCRDLLIADFLFRETQAKIRGQKTSEAGDNISD
jgi:hypothetical protein